MNRYKFIDDEGIEKIIYADTDDEAVITARAFMVQLHTIAGDYIAVLCKMYKGDDGNCMIVLLNSSV